MKRVTSLLILGALGSVAVCACSTSASSIEGNVLMFGPVAHPGTTTTSLPIASFATTVEVKSGGNVVATQRVAPGKRFDLVVPPGNYSLDVAGVPNCLTSAAVVSGATTRVDVRCVEP